MTKTLVVLSACLVLPAAAGATTVVCRRSA